MSKKDILANIFDLVIPDTLLGGFSKLNSNLTVLAYHRVMDYDNEYPFDIDLISATCAEFDSQIKFIKKHFNPITIEHLVECHISSKKLPKSPILITFDDGFEDNYYNAFPILKKHNVPATIFISTDFISQDGTLWFDHLSYIIMNMSSPNLKVMLKDEFNITDVVDDRRLIIEQVMKYVKAIPNTVRIEILKNIESNYEFKIPDQHERLSTTLNWEQIKEMMASGISFGSHTMSHPILSQLDEETLKSELVGSKRIIEEKLNQKIDTIAYPVGTESTFNDKVIDYTSQAKYKLAFSYMQGINLWPLKSVYSLKRLHIERYLNTSRFKCMVSLPSLFSY